MDAAPLTARTGPTATSRATHWLRIDPWIAAALVCGIALRLFRLDEAALWLDETETAIWTSLSPDQIVDTVFNRERFGRYDVRHLPLYFVAVTLWTKLVGLSPFLLRLPSVVFSTLSIGTTAALAHTLAGLRAARWAAWLAALSPFLIHHAQEARMYPLISLLAGLSLLLLVRYLHGLSSRLGIAFVLVNAALLATHYYTSFLIAGELLLLLYLHPRPHRSWFPAACVCALCGLLLTYIALFLTKQTSGEVYEIGLFAFPGVVWSMLSGYALMPSAEELHALGRAAIMPYLPYALAMALPVLVLTWTGLRALSSRARLFVIVLLVCIFLGPFLAATVFPKISLNPRYFTAGAGLILVVIAAGMPRPGAALWRTAAGAAVFGVMAFAVAMQLSEPGQKREDVLAAGAWLERNVAANQELVVTSDEMASLAYFHWPQRKIHIHPPPHVVADAKTAEQLAANLPFNGNARTIYVFGRSWLSDPDNALEQAVINKYTSCGSTAVRGIRIYCLLAPSRR